MRRGALLLPCVLLALYYLEIAEGNGEIFNSRIAVTPINPVCSAAAFARPCIKRDGEVIPAYPPNWPCPCHADGSAGGAVFPASGEVSRPNPYAGQFVDKVVANGFTNPVAMSFTDTGRLLWVSTKEGVVWRVDLSTGEKHIWIDLSDEVCGSGDRGLLGITTNPNFVQNPFVYLLFTVDPIYGAPDEPMEQPANQRLIRIEDAGGMPKAGSRIDLIGGGENDGIPTCYNTHSIGSVQFGLDGSLFITSGEGAHWDFDFGDYGQDVLPHDAECEQRFGAEQDVGAFRSQVLESLGGKLLRIDPGTGKGICAGSGYAVSNPYCDGDPNSRRSKIYATGLRNPFRMTVRPYEAGDAVGPGVVYFGDVGEGGYEEVNAVTGPGQNFGWPCWEGPMPMPRMRDSYLNANSNATWEGNKLNCNYMYQNMKTELPFFTWSRFPPNDNAGYFGEIAYLGQGFTGNTAAGVAVYHGTKYPEHYKGVVFILEYSQWWIRAAHRSTGDTFDFIEDFMHTDTAIVTLQTEPVDGNICYITLNKGEVHCIEFSAQDVPPDVSISANPAAGLAPLAVQFSADGTWDREVDPVIYAWDFGDGAKSNAANPAHTYTLAGTFYATLTATDRFSNSGNATLMIRTDHKAPTAVIKSPTTKNVPYMFIGTDLLQFSATVTAEDPASLTYRWELQLIHANHIHTEQYLVYTPTFSLSMGPFANGHAGERINFRVVLTVKDKNGLTATDYILLTEANYLTKYNGNGAPNPGFITTGNMPYEVGQPIQFDASATVDPDLDYVFYSWNFGDNSALGDEMITSHTYGAPGDYTVTLTVHDNFYAFGVTTQVIHVVAQKAVLPVVYPLSGDQYSDFKVTIKSITTTATIYYTLDGSQPTAQSTKYTAPFTVPYAPYTTVTIKSIAIAAGLDPSAVITNAYTILPPPCSNLYFRPNCSMDCFNPLTENAPGVIVSIPPANGVNSVGAPPIDQSKILRFLITGLYGIYDPAALYTNLNVPVDGGNVPGQAVQIRVSYDFKNDGVWDRVETFELFACDPVTDTFENYAFKAGVNPFEPGANGVVGSAYQDLVNGTVRVEVWQAIGPGTPNMRIYMGGPINTRSSLIKLPYNNTYQIGGSTPCDVKCSGGFKEDVCGICNGPGLTGCDQTCYSTKTYDVCGVCGGPGLTGCDQQCGSDKVVGSCGVCGDAGNCTAPSSSCNILNIRGSCPDLVCRYLNWAPSSFNVIPNANGIQTTDQPPADKTKLLQYQLTGVNGYYNVDYKYTKLNLWVDAKASPGNAVAAAVKYDFTNDGTWDRTEIYTAFTPNDLVGYELWNAIGLPAPKGQLKSATGGWSNMVNGTVQLLLWSAYPTLADQYVLTDSASATNQESFITIPFITSYWGPNNYQGVGACGEVTVPATTGADTTAYPQATTGTTGVHYMTTGAMSSTTAATGVSSTSTTGGSSDPCFGFNCPCPTNDSCPCMTSSCVVSNGAPTCVTTKLTDGTSCTVTGTTLCYTGVCTDGTCTAINYINCIPDNQKPDPTVSSATMQSTISLLLALVLLLITLYY